MNIIDIVIIAVVSGMVITAIRYIKKHGSCSCGCGKKDCGGCCSCKKPAASGNAEA